MSFPKWHLAALNDCQRSCRTGSHAGLDINNVSAVSTYRSDYHGEISSVVDTVASNSASKIGTGTSFVLCVRHPLLVQRHWSVSDWMIYWADLKPQFALVEHENVGGSGDFVQRVPTSFSPVPFTSCLGAYRFYSLSRVLAYTIPVFKQRKVCKDCMRSNKKTKLRHWTFHCIVSSDLLPTQQPLQLKNMWKPHHISSHKNTRHKSLPLKHHSNLCILDGILKRDLLRGGVGKIG